MRGRLGAIRAGLLCAGVLAAGGFPARLPLVFEPIAGEEGFVGKTHGFAVHLTPSGAAIQTVRLRFPNANAHPALEGAGQLPSRTNYLLGGVASRWRVGAPQYSAVRYREIYPGIDLVFHGASGTLEYDFVVNSGADPSRIRLAFDGARGVSIDAAGDLVLRTATGELRSHRPLVYQEGPRREIAGNYVVHGHEARFRLAAFDRTRPLVIDPILTYATYFGGGESDEANAIAVDRDGNAYVAGVTRSTGLPATAGAVQGASRGGFDAFVLKLSASGALVWLTYLGGAGTDSATAIAVDAAGNPYVAGFTSSANFPVTAGVFQAANRGGQNVFVAKLNAAGTALVYSTLVGGGGTDTATSIALTGAG